MYKTSDFFFISETLKYYMLRILRLTYVREVIFLSRICPEKCIQTSSNISERRHEKYNAFYKKMHLNKKKNKRLHNKKEMLARKSVFKKLLES